MRKLCTLCLIALLPVVANAKRGAPPKLQPVTHEGIRYVVPNDDGRRAFIQAWDVQTDNKLWEVTVFRNLIDPNLEEDVQHVFINKCTLADGLLNILDERGRAYSLNLKTRVVKQLKETAR